MAPLARVFFVPARPRVQTVSSRPCPAPQPRPPLGCITAEDTGTQALDVDIVTICYRSRQDGQAYGIYARTRIRVSFFHITCGLYDLHKQLLSLTP
jgi:hypothetical protein